MRSSSNVLWAALALFAVGALVLNWHDNLFTTSGPLGELKPLIWVAFVGFLAYSIYCSTRENLFKTIGTMAELHWGRQIGIDLYLGLLLTLFVVYLNEGSVLITLLWLVPALAFANLVTLLYFAIHFDAIVAKFVN